MNSNGTTGRFLGRYSNVAIPRVQPTVEYVQAPKSGPNQTGLDEIWNILWRRKAQIAAFIVIGVALGTASALVMRAEYQAHTVLEVEGVNENYLNLRDLAPTVPASPYGAEAYLQTQAKILKSESLARRVGKKLKLANAPEFTGMTDNSPVKFWARNPTVPPTSERALDDKIVKRLLDGLNVRTTMQSRIIDVSFDSSDAKLAADVANAFAEEYIAQNLEMRSRAMQRTMEWLNNQVASLKAKLESQNNTAERFTQSAGLIITGDNDNLAEARLRELQTEISRAQAERAVKQSQYETALASPIASATQVVENATLREYQVNLVNLRRQLAELSASLTPAHYKVQRVQAQIAEIETALAHERENTMNRIREQYDAARRREDLLVKAYIQQADTVARQSAQTARYGVMKREIQTAQQLYDSMLQKSLEASVALALTSSNVRVVDRALPPVRPFSPRADMNGAIGLMAGLMVGVAFAIVRTRSDKTLSQPGDIPRLFNVAELGVIPSATVNMIGAVRRKLLGSGSPAEDSVELATWRDGASSVGDSFRSTLASILFSAPGVSDATTLVVTSLVSGEGKTTISSNLAIACAETDRRTLLIDGDLRRPRLHTIFGISNTWGLSDLLRGDEALENMPIDALTKTTAIRGVAVLPSGPGVANVTSLLYSSRMLAVLNRLRRDFDVILIDTAPMLQFPDARVLGRLADQVILVVRASRTTREQMQSACSRLMADHIPVLGAILNDWKATEEGHGYYDGNYVYPPSVAIYPESVTPAADLEMTGGRRWL